MQNLSLSFDLCSSFSLYIKVILFFEKVQPFVVNLKRCVLKCGFYIKPIGIRVCIIRKIKHTLELTDLPCIWPFG